MMIMCMCRGESGIGLGLEGKRKERGGNNLYSYYVLLYTRHVF